MTAPVSVWTSWDEEGKPVGLTVSSFLVCEGEPAQVLGLLGPLSDLAEAIASSERVIVHLLDQGQVRLADQLAGRYPLPPFEGVPWAPDDFGPLLQDCPQRLRARLLDVRETGWFLLFSLAVQDVDLAGEKEPLVNHRGQYVTVGPRRPRDPA
jgi:flavin reductase (DIM6/NTAB) family NADH-FMN oxidoreductase RutF